MLTKTLSISQGLLAAGILCSCSRLEPSNINQTSAKSAEIANQDSIAPILDANRKMMKQADMRMRVQDVQNTTIVLERAASQWGGVVLNSQMENQILESRQIPYTRDSLKEAMIYTSTSYLILRIPVIHLDTFLALSAAQAAFIDNRHILQEDASLQYLSNELQQKANDKISTSNTNTEHLQNVSLHTIDQKIQNIAINDNVKYSTIRLDIYQTDRIDYQIVVNTEKLMKADFGTQIRNGLQFGAQLISQFLVGIIYIWPISVLGILIAGVIYFRRKKDIKRTLPT